MRRKRYSDDCVSSVFVYMSKQVLYSISSNSSLGMGTDILTIFVRLGYVTFH